MNDYQVAVTVVGHTAGKIQDQGAAQDDGPIGDDIDPVEEDDQGLGVSQGPLLQEGFVEQAQRLFQRDYAMGVGQGMSFSANDQSTQQQVEDIEADVEGQLRDVAPPFAWRGCGECSFQLKDNRRHECLSTGKHEYARRS